MNSQSSLSLGLARSLADSARAFFRLSQGGFALLGLSLVFCALALMARPELRDSGSQWLMTWLQQHRFSEIGVVADEQATQRSTAVLVQSLSPEQARVAHWISKKYRVAPEAVGALVAEAYDLGRRSKLEPTLILAIAAIESGFNPFSQSSQGAQGLMQVMTTVHSDKFQHFGGDLAAFDPIANLRVGARILRDCIIAGGSVEAGLRFYVGATTVDDGGYAVKVLSEQAKLEQVARTTPWVALPPTGRSGAKG